MYSVQCSVQCVVYSVQCSVQCVVTVYRVYCIMVYKVKLCKANVYQACMMLN